MIHRDISDLVKKAEKKHPVITLTGPRQSGKTTLCRNLFRQIPYVSLEDPDTRLQARQDPRGFLSAYPKGVILDEIQKVPDLVSYLQGIVDEPKNKKLFVLTGSQNLELSQTISQSLAGRTAVFRLLPFSFHEIKKITAKYSTDRILFTGFYPRIYDKKLDPTEALSAYYETYVERDLRGLSHIHDLFQFQRFVKLCAGRIGQILHLSSLGNEVGVSTETARQWIGLLQATYIVYLLQPYYRNFNKRTIKAPKLYFYDVGLARFLLGITSSKQMSRDPLRGALFENMVVMDILKTIYNRALSASIYYFRDSNGNEVDLLIERDRKIHPLEIKSSQTLHTDFFNGLEFFCKTAKAHAGNAYLIYGGSTSKRWGRVEVFSYKDCEKVTSPTTVAGAS